MPSKIGDTLLFVGIVDYGSDFEFCLGASENRITIETIDVANDDDMNQNDSKRPGL